MLAVSALHAAVGSGSVRAVPSVTVPWVAAWHYYYAAGYLPVLRTKMIFAAGLTLRDKKWGSCAFWGFRAVLFKKGGSGFQPATLPTQTPDSAAGF